ncbi:unnamed protein product [Adineta ricciae]|uniref:G domain-containing protein n=1 Tax=Adineta ricciae TaxID=249248 RepID=A0A816DHT5_ADIRI|nr:unnamed protein product [Adineta ricciae]
MERCFTITVCGASRVGKSTLINAIVGKEVAQTSDSLNSNTTILKEYVIDKQRNENDPHSNYTLKFWDTPGIESWTEEGVQEYFATLMQRTMPVCIIYCISPSSFADLRRVKWFVEQCIGRKIFVALVCTNMYSGNRHLQIMEQFTKLLISINPNFVRSKQENIEYFENKALCTMVNSKQYIDEDFGISKDPSGVNELIFAIAQCLSGEQQLFWLQAVAENQNFWSRMGSYINSAFRIPFDTLSSVTNRASTVTRYFPSWCPSTNIIVEDEFRSNRKRKL